MYICVAAAAAKLDDGVDVEDEVFVVNKLLFRLFSLLFIDVINGVDSWCSDC